MRLLPNGGYDFQFNRPLYCTTFWLITLLPDGKFIAAYDARSSPPTVGRFFSNGDLDSSFTPTNVSSATVIVPQSDGKLLVGFTNELDGMRRLEANGSSDNSFHPVLAFTDGITNKPKVRSMLVEPDGRIVISGHFTSVNGQPRTRIARLFPDGSLDTSFDPGSGLDQGAAAVLRQGDGRIIIAGRFTNVAGVVCNQLARLNNDGSLDRTFDPGSGPGGEITSAVLTSDHKLLLAGSFTNFNSVPASGVVRIDTGVSSVRFSSFARNTNHITELRAPGEPCRSLVLETSADLAHWSALRTNAPNPAELVIRETNSAAQRFYRAWRRFD